MKIGILTQPLLYNYGGLLQNYALQQVLKIEGHTVETIDWKKPLVSVENVLRCISHVKAFCLPKLYKHPNYRPTENERAIIQRNTNRFIKKYIDHTETISSRAGFTKEMSEKKYDAYVVGSDQCWRPMYNCYLYDMYLDFCKRENVKRIAYAASFGTNRWEYSSKKTAICSDLARHFDCISVREDSGINLCKKHLGVDALNVLDPTMLLSKDDYVKLVEEENEPKSAGTLFNYILDPDPEKKKIISRIESELNLCSFKVLPKCQTETRTKDDVKSRIEDCVYPSVTAWLRAFMDSDMTVVDSFHGMVFSIIFNKPFWVIGNESRGLSRFSSLLKMFKLEDRLIDIRDINNIDLNSPIDWKVVNDIWSIKREESFRFLINALK